MIFNQILLNIDDRWNRLLSNIVSPQKLRLYADAVFMKGSPLDNVCGFIDGTLRPCSSPTCDQRAVYNGHKRVHGIKFQSNLTRQENYFNRAMSSVRVSVEWMFGHVINSFKYTYFKKSK